MTAFGRNRVDDVAYCCFWLQNYPPVLRRGQSYVLGYRKKTLYNAAVRFGRIRVRLYFRSQFHHSGVDNA